MKKAKMKFGANEITAPTTVTFTNNKLWAGNTGRSASGLMVGDIITIKKTISLTWEKISADEVKIINNYISSPDNSFFTITLLNEEFEEHTYTVYASDPTYEIWGWNKNRQFVKQLAVDLIEQ